MHRRALQPGRALARLPPSLSRALTTVTRVCWQGMRLELLLNTMPRRDEHGQVIGVLAVAQDVSSIMGTQRDLRQVASDLEKVIDYANAPIFGVDSNYQINEWNRKAASLTGYSKEEVIGQDLVQTYIRAEYRDRVKMVFANALNVRRVALARMHAHICLPDGQWHASPRALWFAG